MDQAFENVLRKNFVILTKQLDLAKVLDHMINDGILTKSNAEIFLINPGAVRNFIINYLLRAGPRAKESFLNALMVSGQTELFDILTGSSAVRLPPVRRSPVRRSPVRSPVRRSPVRRSPVRRSPVRSPVRWSPVRRSPVRTQYFGGAAAGDDDMFNEIIRKKFPVLVNNLDVDKIIHFMVNDGTISRQIERNYKESGKTRSEKTREFLIMTIMRIPNVKHSFLNALEMAGEKRLVDELTGSSSSHIDKLMEAIQQHVRF